MSYIDVRTTMRKVSNGGRESERKREKKTVCCANLRGLSIEERASFFRLRVQLLCAAAAALLKDSRDGTGPISHPIVALCLASFSCVYCLATTRGADSARTSGPGTRLPY